MKVCLEILRVKCWLDFPVAVRDGTKIVILQFGTNDARLNIPPATRQANIAAILVELRKRGIRNVQVDELMDAALRDGLEPSQMVFI